MMLPRRRLVWFSCGAASAVLAKLAVEKYGDGCEIVYCDTMATEHPDNARFFADVERWIGRSIRRIRSTEFATIDDVFMRTRYMAGVAGARCTMELKKRPREAMQHYDDVHLFGYTVEEQRRADQFEDQNPALHVEWLLIDQGVGKQDCYARLRDAEIELPAMYRLGFDHNNCLGCVKAASPRYWNAIRKHFPEVFARRARQSAALGVRLVGVSTEVGASIPDAQPKFRAGKITGYRIFLATLPEDADGPSEQIDCGPVCQSPSTETDE